MFVLNIQKKFSRTPSRMMHLGMNERKMKWVILAKWYWCQINEHKSFFKKKICKGKRCQCGDFQMAFKICHMNNHNNVAQKLKEIRDIHRNKIESEKNFAESEKIILIIARHRASSLMYVYTFFLIRKSFIKKWASKIPKP